MRHITWLAAALCLLCSCGTESASEADAVPQASAQKRRLLLVIHGGGDDPTDWADDFIAQVAPTLPDADRWASYAVDWSADAEDRTSASRKGLRLGEAIGEALNERDVRYEHALSQTNEPHHDHNGERAYQVRQCVPNNAQSGRVVDLEAFSSSQT